MTRDDLIPLALTAIAVLDMIDFHLESAIEKCRTDLE